MRKFIIHDDKKVEINTFGKSGKILILLPGWTHDFKYETKFVNELSKNCIVITISYPGYSQSQENRNAQSAKFLSTIISTIKNSYELSEFTLIGFSMGCQIVLYYLKDHPTQEAILISPILHSLLLDTPLYGQMLLSSVGLLQGIRKSTMIKKFLVNKAYSNIGNVTENSGNRSQFTTDRVSLNGAFDTLIATLTSFIDPVGYKDRIKFLFGDREIMQQRLDKVHIPYTIIKDSGHGSFEKNYKQIAQFIT